MDEKTLVKVLAGSLEMAGWLVLPEFGVGSYEGFKKVDVTAFKWKNDVEVEVVPFECKCQKTARESFLAALGQAVEYQRFFPEVFIVTQNGEFFPDQKSILEKLGLGLMMINEQEERELVVAPSIKENSLFDESLFSDQVRNRAVLLLVFNELFPEAQKKGYFGGQNRGELWIYNKPIGDVQFRAWTGIGSDSYLGINIEAVELIRNITRNMDVDQLLEVFGKLPPEYTVDLGERATIKDKSGHPILLDRQKGSVPIEGSIFESHTFSESGFPACNLTKEQIQKEIIERSKTLNYFTHLLIDKKVWEAKSKLTQDQYFKEILKAKETLDEVYNRLTHWSE